MAKTESSRRDLLIPWQVWTNQSHKADETIWHWRQSSNPWWTVRSFWWTTLSSTAHLRARTHNQTYFHYSHSHLWMRKKLWRFTQPTKPALILPVGSLKKLFHPQNKRNCLDCVQICLNCGKSRWRSCPQKEAPFHRPSIAKSCNKSTEYMNCWLFLKKQWHTRWSSVVCIKSARLLLNENVFYLYSRHRVYIQSSLFS